MNDLMIKHNELTPEVPDMEIYCIGSSPCSGKSTVAEALAEHNGHLMK